MFKWCNGRLAGSCYFHITAISFELGPSCNLKELIFFILLKQINLHKIILTGHNFLSTTTAFYNLLKFNATLLGYFLMLLMGLLLLKYLLH